MDLLELNQFPSVAANAPATLVTDELLDRTILGLVFEQGGTAFTKAHVDDVRISVDGKDLVEGITGLNLQSLNTYNGQNDTANYLVHWFGDPTARTIRGQWIGALDMSVYRAPLEIEVGIGAATAPTLKTYAILGPPKAAMGVFSDVEAAMARALVRTVVQPAAAVNRKSYQIGLGAEAGARLRALHFFHANLDSVEFRKQSDIKHEDISVALNSFVQSEFARVPAAGHYALDRIIDGNQGEAETTLKPDGRPWPFQVMLSTSAADTIYTYADIHTALPLI